MVKQGATNLIDAANSDTSAKSTDGTGTQSADLAKSTNNATSSTDGRQSAGRRRGGRRQNSWLSHVKQTMKMHKGKSFKQILQLAKKSYHNRQSQSHSQSQSNQNGGKRRRQKSRKTRQNGGSGAKQGFSVADNAAPY